MRILIADDDADLRALIGFTLMQAGFDVSTAVDGESALQAFQRDSPDLVLLAVNMPEPNGLKVCREIRGRSPVPIMMLTVRDVEEELIEAFDSGADDYVCKPFSPRALLARVRALIRRSEPFEGGAMSVGNIRLDPDQRTLQLGMAPPLRLTPLESKALQLLMATPGRTVTAEKLLLHLWGRATARERRTLKQLIYRLRNKIEVDTSSPELLRTTPGAGYKLMVD
ncbi:response regulator transcription factor [Steroidobacter sp. S1-65]|uniref:Response regulator transcription factor n=1 Tax=Steroidobacter gossypii TaxID=2805490 RepID=A0ABS1WTI7_9GAMM|nr:response regulator transcription factor [Steroidobacter gossypii]MBM0104292.1 response regulator transcription factor [Steroidobacter gossypii]